MKFYKSHFTLRLLVNQTIQLKQHYQLTCRKFAF